MRAPSRNDGNKNTRARWLRNGLDGGGVWTSNSGGSSSTVAMHGGDKVGANFMEVDGNLRDILGGDGIIQIVERNQEVVAMYKNNLNKGGQIKGNNLQGEEINIVDSKKKRLEHKKITDKTRGNDIVNHGLLL